MNEKRNRSAEDQVRSNCFQNIWSPNSWRKNKRILHFFPTQLRMEKLSHRIHNLRNRGFRGEPRLLVPKVSSSDQQQFIKFWNGTKSSPISFPSGNTRMNIFQVPALTDLERMRNWRRRLSEEKAAEVGGWIKCDGVDGTEESSVRMENWFWNICWWKKYLQPWNVKSASIGEGESNIESKKKTSWSFNRSA